AESVPASVPAPSKTTAPPDKVVQAETPKPSVMVEKSSAPPQPSQSVTQAPMEVSPKPTQHASLRQVDEPAPKSATMSAALAPPTVAPTMTAPVTTDTMAAVRETAPTPKSEPVSTPPVRAEVVAATADDAGATSQLFFEVGKFKKSGQAQQEIAKLADM